MKQTSYNADSKQVELLLYDFQAQYKAYLYQLAFPNSYVVMILNTGGINLQNIMVKKQLQSTERKAVVSRSNFDVSLIISMCSNTPMISAIDIPINKSQNAGDISKA